MKYILPFLLVFLFLGGNVRAQDQQSFDPAAAQYLWPTEASPYLSSTFAETRSAHFHAAIDIKTWGQRGYEVYATRDGIVARIATGPKGYGKVVYLKHADGSYSVYAHLLSFNEELQQLADSIRFAENYRFQIDRFVGWRNMEVEQGDVIGYSGASGIGPPHLHFELRTPSHRPYNPLLTNLSVDDRIAPQILGVSAEPLSPYSSVEGENKIYTKRAWGKKGKYDAGSITVSGPVGLGINVFDQSNRVNNSYAVYEIKMSVDGQELFTARADSFSYAETDQMFIDRVYPLLKNLDEGYQRLFVADGNTLPFYSNSPSNGRLNLEPGSYSVSIETTDFYGNTSTASLRLIVQEKNPLNRDLPKKEYTTKAIALPHQWSWFNNWVSLTKKQFDKLTIGISNDKFIWHHNNITLDLQEQDNLFMQIPKIGPIVLRRINPDTRTIVSADNNRGYAVFPENTVYDTLSAGMAVKSFKPDSMTVDIIPEAFPLRNSYRFFVQRDSALTDISKLSFYHLDRDDHEWDLIPTSFSDTQITAEAEDLGTFTLKRDTSPPTLENPRLRQRPDGRWLVLFDVRDSLSGMEYSRSKITVNGIRGIGEFEPEDNRLVYYHPSFVPNAMLDIEVTVYDKMGNKQTAAFQLETNAGQAKK